MMHALIAALVAAFPAQDGSPSAAPRLPAAPSATRAAGESAEPVVHVSIQVVAFEAGTDLSRLPFSVTASGDVALRAAEDGPTPLTLLRLIQAREISVRSGANQFTIGEDGLLSQPGDGSSPPWKVLAAPRIAMPLGQDASVSVGREVPFMLRRDDGCLSVETSPDIVEGFSISLKAEKTDEQGIHFSAVEVRCSRVAGRQPLDGVPFEVGRPILDVRQTRSDLVLAPDHTGMFSLFKSADDSPVVVFLTAKMGALPR